MGSSDFDKWFQNHREGLSGIIGNLAVLIEEAARQGWCAKTALIEEAAWQGWCAKIALHKQEVAASGVPSQGKPASLLDNGSLTTSRVAAGVPPSDNTSQLAIAARETVDAYGLHYISWLDDSINNLRFALQQQA